MLLLLLVAALAQDAVGQTSSPPPAKRPAPATRAVRKPTPSSAAAAALASDTDKTVYALAFRIAKEYSLTPAELDIMRASLADAKAGKPKIDIAPWMAKLPDFAQDRRKAASQQFLEHTATQPGWVKTGSGLLYKETQAGTGASPTASDQVKVQYRGTLTDGTEFDSSYSRNQPAEFPLDHVIRCWTEGVARMKVGGKATLVCPANLAYGERATGPIPPGSTLIFDVELLEILGK